jgi:integrase
MTLKPSFPQKHTPCEWTSRAIVAVFFLALYSGARLEELASLALSQVQRDGEIWYFEIAKAKNANSQRRIPLHRTIVESGFLTYVESVKESGATQLILELKSGKNG